MKMRFKGKAIRRKFSPKSFVFESLLSAVKSTYTLLNILPLLIQNYVSYSNHTALLLFFHIETLSLLIAGENFIELPTSGSMHYTLCGCTGLDEVASEISHDLTISRASLPFCPCKGVALCPCSPLFLRGGSSSFVTPYDSDSVIGIQKT